MANPINSIVDYVRSSIAELKKVSWPTKDMTIRYASTVIVVCIALAAFFGALDFGFSKLVTTILSRTPATPTQPAPAPVVPDVQPTATPTTDQSANQPIQIDPSATDNGPIQKK